jgi:anti-sigma28 factor (negative regulator of flagellin synthesis)
MDKISAIQSALAAGTYQVSASALASSVVDSMLGAR